MNVNVEVPIPRRDVTWPVISPSEPSPGTAYTTSAVSSWAVPAGVTVKLDLVSTDVVHGWNVPELTGKAQAVPGSTSYLYFRADDVGTYTNRSSVFSGQGYDTMEIEVDVVPPAAYEKAIEVLKSDIQRAQDKVELEFRISQKKSEVAAAHADKMEADINKADIESADSK